MSELLVRLDRIDRVLAASLCFFAGVAVTLMMLHIIASIVARQFFATPLGGVTEIVSAYDMVAVTFLPLAYVTRQKAHISVDLFTQWLSPRAILVIEWLATVFIALISIWVFFESMAVAIDSIQVGEVWESGDGFLYVWPSRLFVPIGVGAMGFSLVVDTIKLGCRLFGSDSNIHSNDSN